MQKLLLNFAKLRLGRYYCTVGKLSLHITSIELKFYKSIFLRNSVLSRMLTQEGVFLINSKDKGKEEKEKRLKRMSYDRTSV